MPHYEFKEPCFMVGYRPVRKEQLNWVKLFGTSRMKLYKIRKCIRIIFVLFCSFIYAQEYHGICPKPDYSHKRGFYFEPFYLLITSDCNNSTIRYTTDGTKPDRQTGLIYSSPVYIDKNTTIRAVAYSDSLICSEIRTHSFIFPKQVLTQDNSGVPEEEHDKDHVFWTEEFDMSDVNRSEQEMIEALLDIPTIVIAAPEDSIFGIAGIHRGQNLEENGGDPVDPNWIELVECSVELIYPETYRDGLFKNWQENCGIKIQGGASRWQNGSLDHKQSFTLKFKSRYGAGMLKNDILVSAPYNSESVPDKFDKIILRTGFNRDFGSDWDRANYAYTRDQFGRDLQILMTGWGCHGTYVHLYINGRYWGITNPSERMDNHAMATYFGGESDDYFYGKGKEGVRFGRDGRYNYLINTDWTDRQLSEIEELLAVDAYIDLAILHCYANAGDSPQYYFGGRLYPVGPIYYSCWDFEDSFDGGARRSGPPVSMENYNMPYSRDKFDAYFKMKNNIDFKMRFADRVYNHCFNDGILADHRVSAIWDSSCKVIEKAMLCEIARWGDERGPVYDHAHWKKECQDVRNDFIGRAEQLVVEFKKSGMYPDFEPLYFKMNNKIIFKNIFNCAMGSLLTIVFLDYGNGKFYYTVDGSDPRTWDLTGNVSETAIEIDEPYITIPINDITTLKARIKNENEWSPLQELKLIPKKSSAVVINEINYDSAPHFDTEDWVELYNNTETAISLTGWKLSDSDNSNIFEFGSNTLLDADSYLIVCRDTSDFKAGFEHAENYVGELEFRFSNDGDEVRLFDPYFNLIDSVSYDDEDPWPIATAGNGPTLELLNPNFNNAQPENWCSSKRYGTPGRENSSFVITYIGRENDIRQQPAVFSLSQNYPNPFNQTTNINYTVSSAVLITLKIYTITGSKVITLISGYQNPGKYSVEWNAQDLASGIYLCHLKAKGFSDTRKLILIK